MNRSLAKVSETLITSTTLLLIFLFPLFFLPTTANFFETNKLMLVTLVSAVNLLAWGVHVISQKSLRLSVTPFTIPVMLLAFAVLLSSFLAANNPVQALLGRGTLLPALAFLVFTAVNTINSKKFAGYALYALIGSAVILSIISIFQSLGFGLSGMVNALFGTTIPDTLAFTPAGSPLALLAFIAPVLIISLILAFTRKENLEKIVLFLLSAIITAALVLVLVFSLPGKDTAPIFLPFEAGYSIALETLKSPRRALLGFGPESFANAYNRSRPAGLNLTRYWNIRFTNSSNELFEIVTTTGFAGLIAWTLLGFAIIKSLKVKVASTEGKVVKIGTVGLLFLLILIPATYVHLFALMVMIIIWSVVLKTEKSAAVKDLDVGLYSLTLVRSQEEGTKAAPIPVLPYLTAIPFMLLAVTVLFFASKAYAAEMKFKNALDAAAKNEGVQTYNLQREAIMQNPYVARYRRAYSATNLALANSLAAKQDLNDEDRQNITQLIQQSIREAKAAVTLDPENAANWENLTLIYRSLINVAENADRWTVASLAQAIQNDPINPRLRLELGGVYYALGQYDQSIRLYQQAAELKPDWANAYYNLSSAHKQKKELAQAYDYMRQVVSLVEPDTADYTKAQEELKALAEQLNVPKDQQPQAQAPQGDLQVPSPAPTRAPNQQVELPENSGPNDIDNTIPETTTDTVPTPAVTLPAPTTAPSPAPTTQP